MKTIGISAGNVEYSVEDAAVSINEMILMLQSARQDGATHVVGFSGNYRGAQYVRLGTEVEFLDVEDEDQGENTGWTGR